MDADYEAIVISDYSGTNNDKSNEAMPYTYPTITTVKGYSKASSSDYEVCPAINLLELQTSYRYEEASTSIFADDIVAEELADDEQIYEDPGHKEETMYLWFEENKFQKLEISSIKCVAIAIASYVCVCDKIILLGYYSNLDQVNLEWLILAYGLMVLLILYK